MKHKVLIFLLFWIGGASTVYAQSLNGIIRDSMTKSPLILASIAVYDMDGVLLAGAESDFDGNFQLNLENGRYLIEGSYIGYQKKNKEVVIPGNTKIIFDLTERISAPILIRCFTRPLYQENKLSLAQQDFNRMPGAFDDPTRLAIKYPAVSVSNDQANGLIYRGLPSHFNRWSVNGATSVNPNHTSNAGTASDIGSVNAGGVNMYGGQSIGLASFTGNPSFGSTNALGLSQNVDMGFNKSYYQLSLLGLEAGFKKNRFSANYRYSFTGLLGNLGVDFGGERIAFQDAKMSYGTAIKAKDKYIGELGVFAAWGRSSNDFTMADEPTTLKEFQNINYASDIYMVGTNIYLSKIGSMKAYYSRRKSDRTALGNIPTIPAFSINDNADFTEEVVYFSQNFRIQKTHIQLDQTIDILDLAQDYLGDFQQYKGSFTTINISAKLPQKEWGENMFRAEPRFTYHSLSNELIFNPMLEMKSYIYDNSFVLLTSNHQSMNIPGLFLPSFSTDNFSAIKSYNFQASYRREGRRDFEVQIFYHSFYDVPIYEGGVSLYNNVAEYAFVGQKKADLNRARSYGTAFLYENVLNEKIWWNTNIALFQSEYRNNDQWLAASNNYGYTGNFSIGYNHLTKKKNTLRTSLSGHFRGGENRYPLLTAVDRSIPDTEAGLSQRLSDFMRIDARVVLEKDRSTWSLDIQNLTSNLNDAFYFLDQPSGEIQLQKGLGLLPVLSYKRTFN